LEDGTGKALHPAQKPIKLMAKLISIEPSSVLDPFMGLGSTGVVCVYAGVDFVGIETDSRYYDIASQRIEQAGNLPLFALPEIEQMAMQWA